MDLMQFEPLLCAGLRRFFDFKTHSLHFPVIREGEEAPRQAEFLPGENRLLLPLKQADGDFLGLFVARGVNGAAVKKLLPVLPNVAALCLDNLALYKATRRDAVTGLLNRESLIDFLVRELERMAEYLGEYLRPTLPASSASPASLIGPAAGLGAGRLNAPEPDGPQAGRAEKPASLVSSPRFGLLVIRLNGLGRVVREHGYLRSEKLLRLLADELSARKPQQALAARSGEYEFALLLPGFGPQACRELGLELAAALDKVRLANELTGRKAGVSVSIGYVNCPRDLDGLNRQLPAEQARLLLRRARLAGAVVHESLRQADELKNRRFFAGLAEPRAAVLSYGGILAEGGRVLETMPLSRMIVSLGKSAGARPGQRFTVWGYVLEAPDSTAATSSGSGRNGPKVSRRYKGEVTLVDVRQNESTAELIYCDDPYFPPEAGDQLLLNSLPGLSGFEAVEGGAFYPAAGASLAAGAHPDPGTGFLAWSDFLPRWCQEREKHDKFSLLLTRFGLPDELPETSDDGGRDENGDPAVNDGAGESPESTGSIDKQWEALLGRCAERFRETFGPDCLYGRYALNSFVVLVPGGDTAALAEKAARLGRELALDSHLSIKTGEGKTGETGLQSAFGIAPHPFLDFRKADVPDNAHKALEYALLLPEPHVGVLDTLALNISADRRFSLGDQLGAISEYKKALLCDEDNILAWNSLGVTLAGLGRHLEARRCFDEALKREADDFTALYNLGQLCQSLGEAAEAERLYLRCRELQPDNVYTVYRLGQLAEQRGNLAGARKFYEEAMRFPGGQLLTRRGLARLAIKEGRLEDAREELHEALLLNPNDALALQLMAGLYLDAGEDPRVAESLARQSAALRPDLKAAWQELARALEALGKHAEAREATIKAGEL